MERTHSRLQQLMELHLAQSLTDDERDELWGYIDDPLFEAEIKNILGSSFNEVAPEELEEARQQSVLQHIFEQQPSPQPKPIARLWPKIAFAASLLIVIGLGSYFYWQKPATLEELALKNNIKAGGNKATLTFADGRQLVLNERKTGIVIKADQLSYTDGTRLAHLKGKSDYYTLSTPKGGTYQLLLTDGSKVWLNAQSSIKFAANFSNHRHIELEGEAYFEVAKDKRHVFTVSTINQRIEALGTAFNINSYPNEKEASTTLTTGSVRIWSIDQNQAKAKNILLRPGQQARAINQQLTVKEADTSAIVAWKNGYFNFENEDIKSIMSQIAKWYDVEPVYVGGPFTERYSGQISRSRNIGAVLDIIQSTNDVSFKIDGRKIKVIH